MARLRHRRSIARTDRHPSGTAIGLLLIVWALLLAGSATAQQPLTVGTPLPGTVGPWRPGAPVYPYFQPVEFIGPPGVAVSVAYQGTFTEPQPAPTLVGLLVHPVYRLRVTGAPDAEGRELFPTVELLDRLCAPPGAVRKFPIPIELTAEDLRLAMAGNFVTRVIYVEDPQTALPIVGDAEHPNWYDAGPGADPVAEARQIGRPVAILRMGGILPDDRTGPDMQFLNGCPPFALLSHPPARTTTRPAQQPAAEQQPAEPQAELVREPVP